MTQSRSEVKEKRRSPEDSRAGFAEAMKGAGLPVPDIVGDGVLHRFSTNGKRSDESGWYVLHLDGTPAGAFGDWRTGLRERWCAGTEQKFTVEQQKEYLQKLRTIKRQRDRDQKRRHDEAARRASVTIEGLSPAPADHPYFQRKGIHADILVDDNLLIVPMTDPDGRIASLQFIDESGKKKFLPGGRVTGCYFIVGEIADRLVIAEGLATAASVRAATGYAVAVAFHAGNLLPVATVMRRKYPDSDLIVAADNDIRDDDSENTGVVKAKEAASAVGGRLAVPQLDGKKCDFNDVHVMHGLDAVRSQIDGCSSNNEGAKLLDDVCAFIRRFCAFPDTESLIAVTLWGAHAHMIESFHTTPRLALLSPEPESGKTRVLEVLELLAPEAMLTLNASPATIFRTLENRQITLLFDECDTIWSKRGKDDNHEELRALLNAGYRRGAAIPRCVGPRHEITMFPVFCAVALAGIGDLPDTIMSRSVIIRMRRRAPGEKVEPFRFRKHAPPGNQLRDRLVTWSAQIGSGIRDSWPLLPPGIDDRPAEIWEPLLAVADAAGGHWPATARQACVSLCRVAEDRTVTLGIRLLADLRTIFGDADALHTATILERLTSGDELESDAPWSDLRGKPLSDRGLASMLKQYGIRSVKLREPLGSAKMGYRREALWDAWQRYLPLLSAEGEHGEHFEQSCKGEGSSRSPSVPYNGTGGTQGEHETLATAREVPDVPHVPLFRDTGSACPACAGEGCRHCGDTGRNPERL